MPDPAKCPVCKQSCSWMLKAERWRCHVCPRWVDAPRPPVVSLGQGEYAKEIK